VYKNLLEKVFKYLDKEALSDQISDAKREYFERIGSVFEGDSIFEMRMASFFDWFVYDRPVTGVGLSPIKVFLFANGNLLEPDEKECLANLQNTILSLFSIDSRSQNGFKLKDLFDGKDYTLPEKSELSVIGFGTIVEARLIPDGDGHCLSDPVFSHPQAVSKLIGKEALKYANCTRHEFYNLIFRVAAMSIRYFRYKHLAVENIYNFNEAKV
jgi:hypothetical protein